MAFAPTNWHDVLERQLHLHRALSQRRLAASIDPQIADELGPGYDEAMSRAALGALAEAAPVYVAPEVASLWDHARRDFVPERFDESEPFVPNGFALLPDSYNVDAGYPAAMRAVLWATLPGFVPVWGFAAVADKPHLGITEHFIRAGLELADVSDHSWTITWGNGLQNDAKEHAYVEALQDVRAFWRLGREFVAGTERAPRGLRRAASRANVINSEHVTVLRLRRHTHAAVEAASEVDWSCRWIVRGHWRNQWYPSLREHRQRYVAPHIKGPPDKPLRIADRAVEFIR